MSAAANKQLIQQVYADSANRSGTTFIDHLDDDVRWIVTGQYSWSHRFEGRDAVLNGLQGHFRSLIEGRPRTVAYNFMADGDYVVLHSTDGRGHMIRATMNEMATAGPAFIWWGRRRLRCLICAPPPLPAAPPPSKRRWPALPWSWSTACLP